MLSKKIVLITTDHHRLHDPQYFPFNVNELCEEGNVFAISLNGDILWKFEDMVDKFIYPSTGGYILSKDDYAPISELYKTRLILDHEYYIALTMASEYYLFDLTTNTYIGKNVFRN